jgi:peptidoglycan hydrolase CwlO-like protein
MRSLRSLSLATASVLVVAAFSFDGGFAQAQSVEDAESEADQAEERADAATGLVDEAVAARSDIELQLTETIARVNDLSAHLSTVSLSLDKLQGQIVYADAELIGLASAIEVQAIDAYMTALAAPISFINTDNVEKALVAGLVVQDVVTAGREKVDQLVFKKRGLEELQAEFRANETEVAALKEQVDAEMAKLEGLYEEADTAVAEAIREANAADVAYRAALSSVEVAQAREAENRRQEQRSAITPTTTPPTTKPPTTTAPPSIGSTTSPTTTPSTTTTPPTTTTPTTTTPPTSGGGGGGGYTFPPAVEQWRGLVEQHFPSHRVEEALRIMKCESNGDPNAYNPYSGASGLFQFLPSTWAVTAPKAGYDGASVFDPVANTASAAWLANRYEELGEYHWQAWSCRRVLN